MYKVLAKVLANRIRRVMESVIGDSQMDFIRNRQILDSFVIAEEVIHEWRKDKDGGLLVKLDFNKAYDSMDHIFMDNMLEGMAAEVAVVAEAAAGVMVVNQAVVVLQALKPQREVLETSVRPEGFQEEAFLHLLQDSGINLKIYYRYWLALQLDLIPDQKQHQHIAASQLLN
ncbi:hypothetical protein Dsin_014051 [Dipteronia sinensis]|uniref:Reverse transcriptase domain-containing protein n=1 Tax=Dipteronia sinensis TaxID=43782 RepID=A0AAE0AL68_9ROSI|nr:hypothetical protein Dsin_014051 [Dipteronia sinensis]